MHVLHNLYKYQYSSRRKTVLPVLVVLTTANQQKYLPVLTTGVLLHSKVKVSTQHKYKYCTTEYNVLEDDTGTTWDFAVLYGNLPYT